ncbi:MAG TPA: hypothetical protein VFJ97_05895 [Dermatophilaceae bacterium]|nr:hypothetical protein [Dermatophilaceae bacterium]
MADRDVFDLPLLRGERFGALVLARVVVAAGLLTVLVSACCAALAPLGLWTPALALPLLLVLTAVAVRLSAPVSVRPLPVWTSLTLVGLALGTALWAGLTHTQQVLPRRDAGSYAQAATVLATVHRTPLEVPARLVGTALSVEGVTLASPAFYQVGSLPAPKVQPQFLIGAPAWYSVGRWLGGTTGMLVTPALFGGLAVLAVGLLTAAAVGARWAPLGSLAVAVGFPFLHTARATYSEPPALLVLLAGLLVLTAATQAGGRGRWRNARRLGLLAGVLVGGAAFVRADALRETILLLPVAALLVVRRDGPGWSLLAGAGVSTGLAGVAGLGLSYRYLGDIAASLVPLLVGGVVLAAGMAVVVLLARRGAHLPAPVCRVLPWASPAGVLLVGAVLATRPFWTTVRQSALDPGARVVAGLQARQGLPVDGGRTYAEQTLEWTSWWVGPAAVAVTFLVLAFAAQRLATAWVAAQPLPAWTGAAVVAFGSSVLTWYRPGITPDHPWADRRLLVSLAMVAVCSVGACAWVTRWAARRMPATVLALVGLAAPVLLIGPSLLATWPHRAERVEAGEVAAVDTVCAAFAPGEVALMVDDRAANEWPQVLRGTCRVPALSLTSAVRRDDAARRSAVASVRVAVEAAGGRLVLLAADSPDRLGGRARRTLDVTVLEDARLLERRPDHLVALPLQVWLAPA